MTDVVYLNGWYDEEHDGVQTFRWMSREAHCRITPSARGVNWLRVIAAHHFDTDDAPRLSVSVDSVPAGECAIGRGCFAYLFPFPACEPADVHFRLDRTFQAPGDSRDLGLAIRGVEVLDLEHVDAPLDAEGWHAWEHQDYFAFRWMGREARVLVPAHLCKQGRFASVPMYSDPQRSDQVVTISANGSPFVELSLRHDWHVYEFELPSPDQTNPLELTFRVNRLLPRRFHETDPRELGIPMGCLELHDDARRYQNVRRFFDGAPLARDNSTPQRDGSAESAPFGIDANGWSPWQVGAGIPFRWIGREATARIGSAERADARFCSIPVASDYDDLSQIVTLQLNGNVVAQFPLVFGWGRYGVALPERGDADIEMVFRVNKTAGPAQRATDRQHLAVRVGMFSFHSDEARHRNAVRFAENAVRNRREYEQGAAVLSSFPISLGIDLYGKCNIKPPCVYCLWDQAKQLEGNRVSAIVDDRTLAGYADFFHSAQALVNCSFGEPLLHPRLREVLDLLSRFDKEAEIATNGQAFTPETVKAVAGKALSLYVSLDAASATTYARLRNDRWHDVLTGLIFLREARRAADWLPRLNMVFMPMRANRDDLEQYFKLCRMLRATSLVLRPLTYHEAALQVDRGGYHFDYAREILPRHELQDIFERCREYSARYRVPVANQFDFGLKDAQLAGRGDA